MKLIRRRFLHLAATAVAAPAALPVAWAEAQYGEAKANQLLRGDLQGQGHQVQETVVTIVEFPPGTGAPWHMHPGAQEIFYELEGSLTVEVEGQGTTIVKPGDISLIAADVPHAVRNESTSAPGRALVVHSRSEKDKPLRVDVKKPT